MKSLDYGVPLLSVSLLVLLLTLTECKARVWDSANPYTYSSIKATLIGWQSHCFTDEGDRGLRPLSSKSQEPALWYLTSNPSRVSVVNFHMAALLWLPGS